MGKTIWKERQNFLKKTIPESRISVFDWGGGLFGVDARIYGFRENGICISSRHFEEDFSSRAEVVRYLYKIKRLMHQAARGEKLL